MMNFVNSGNILLWGIYLLFLCSLSTEIADAIRGRNPKTAGAVILCLIFGTWVMNASEFGFGYDRSTFWDAFITSGVVTGLWAVISYIYCRFKY